MPTFTPSVQSHRQWLGPAICTIPLRELRASLLGNVHEVIQHELCVLALLRLLVLAVLRVLG